MEWSEVFCQIIISLITTTVGLFIGYCTMKDKLNALIEKVRIESETEIKKIQEASKSELDKINAQTDARIKEKMAEYEINSQSNEEQMKNEFTKEFLTQFMENPEQGMKNIDSLQRLSNKVNRYTKSQKKRKR